MVVVVEHIGATGGRGFYGNDSMTDPARKPTLAVVGGGLAGMAAAVAAAERGCRVELFEGRKTLGGRAGSFRDPQTGQWVDLCQHVAMGCCGEFADFCRRTGVADCFRTFRTLYFFGPDGVKRVFRPSRRLPAPWHLAPALLRLRYLTLGERWGVARAIRRLARERIDDAEPGETIGAWLRRHGQTERTIERFWSVVLVSALSETVDRASLAAAQKVFADGFMASRTAYELVVPRLPLVEIFDVRAGKSLEEQGVSVYRGARVKQIVADGTRSVSATIVFADGTRQEFDFVVVAVPWYRVRLLLPESALAVMPDLDGVEQIEPAAITALHLWFDRPIIRLPHAVLVGRPGQWVFHHGESEAGHRFQVVISASGGLIGREREAVLAEVLDDLKSIRPAVRDAELVHWRMVTQPRAVFSVTPGLERLRPTQQTPVPNLLLAGDWTSTGWPATMEGAVRSGYAAASAVCSALHRAIRL